MGVVGFSSPGFTSFRFRFGFLPPCPRRHLSVVVVLAADLAYRFVSCVVVSFMELFQPLLPSLWWWWSVVLPVVVSEFQACLQ
ncbi:hypothetical protein P8452_65825 [Trifolium repens]|nr:hypothetical protein P8452_46784 [Trifolium repens]WJX83147.1 hypothetical protein P8452_65825 [Trifolium repens]